MIHNVFRSFLINPAQLVSPSVCWKRLLFETMLFLTLSMHWKTWLDSEFMLHEKRMSLITGFTLSPEHKQLESCELIVHQDGKILSYNLQKPLLWGSLLEEGLKSGTLKRWQRKDWVFSRADLGEKKSRKSKPESDNCTQKTK